MAWFWTDDLAHLLIARDDVSPAAVAHWISAPIAHRADSDALDVARTLLARERQADVAEATSAA